MHSKAAIQSTLTWELAPWNIVELLSKQVQNSAARAHSIRLHCQWYARAISADCCKSAIRHWASAPGGVTADALGRVDACQGGSRGREGDRSGWGEEGRREDWAQEGVQRWWQTSMPPKPERLTWTSLALDPLNSGCRYKEIHWGCQGVTSSKGVNAPLPQWDSGRCPSPIGVSGDHFGTAVPPDAGAV